MTDLDSLIDSLRHRPVATTAAQMREAADTLEQLHAVAVAAKALAASASGITLYAVTTQADGSLRNAPLRDEETVSESALTDLESALAEAGYDMTDEEFEARCGR